MADWGSDIKAFKDQFEYIVFELPDGLMFKLASEPQVDDLIPTLTIEECVRYLDDPKGKEKLHSRIRKETEEMALF